MTFLYGRAHFQEGKGYLISGSFFRFSSSGKQYDQHLVFKLEYILNYLLIIFKINYPIICFFRQTTS